MIQDSLNLHSQYPDFSRHWCDTSEQFAGGDALLTAMQNHWVAEATCYEEQLLASRDAAGHGLSLRPA